MDSQLLFKIFNGAILLPWALLLFLPKWKGTQRMIEWKFPVLFLGLAYFVLLINDLGTTGNNGIDFSSLEAIKTAFGRDEVMLIGWIHYLAFDLFVGMWESVDAQKNGLPHYLLVPCLVLTLMYGPLGFVLYWVFRQFFASSKKR
ncbi:ABA4-like family protein [Aureispira anguillae]|uniref:ABA4-like family protein n=1 Tax=Aureispira anguillae TaxID=2864201 RepID=A0A915YHG1_9BACT|nr:ABA4-like family protein [Aureispira anguillae]BDS13125.1 ABA4-like family protein [Aureispira anguillae]